MGKESIGKMERGENHGGRKNGKKGRRYRGREGGRREKIRRWEGLEENNNNNV